MFETDIMVDWGADSTVPPPVPSWIVLDPPPSRDSFTGLDDAPPPAEARAEDEGAPEEDRVALTPPPAPAPAIAPPAPALDLAPDLAREAEIAALRQALRETVASTARARQKALRAAEQELVRLAVQVAQKIVGREIETHPELIVAWAREGIAALSAPDEVVVALAPDLLDGVPIATWEGELAGVARVIVDAALPPGRCEVRAQNAHVDASLAARVSAVTDALVEVEQRLSEGPA